MSFISRKELQEMLALAGKSLLSQAQKRDEDIEKWAEALAADLCRADEEEYETSVATIVPAPVVVSPCTCHLYERGRLTCGWHCPVHGRQY